MRDRVRHLATLLAAAAALDDSGDELGRAFTVAYDRLREAARDVGDRGFELERVAGRRHRRTGAGRDQDQGIVGRGVAIDRDAVEGALGGAIEELLQALL